MAKAVERATRLSDFERILLLVPVLGGVVFGLGPLLAPAQFGQAAGGVGNDHYIYQLAGAATLGYAAALVLALRRDSWAGARLLVIAVLGFNVASLFACGAELATGHTQAVIVLILVASLVIAAITGYLVYAHRDAPGLEPDISAWVFWFLVAATLVSVPFGLLPLFFPQQFGHAFGFKATDTFVFRQGGAALCGYALLGLFELRSRSWTEIRSAAVMVVVFNGLTAVISLLTLATGGRSSLAYIVAPAATIVAVATIVELVRRGR